MSKFQAVVLGIFVVGLVGGVIAFSTYKNNNSNDSVPMITIWGTFPASVFNQYVTNINNSLANPLKVQYVQKSSQSFNSDFVNALALGQGPDVILIPADSILPQENKLTEIPFSAFSERNFKDSFIQEASLYLGSNGILAIPFTIDPLVMFWNRDTYNASGVPTYPTYWGDFAYLNSRMTVKDSNGNIRKSAVALGDFSNIVNAREVLGSLILQSGNPVVAPDNNGTLHSMLKVGGPNDPSSAIKFFTDPVNPTSSSYSWNRAMANDKDSFLAGTLATYFGFASELYDIRNKNPNLNFDVAMLPQFKSGGVKATYGRMYGFSIVRASAYANAAFQLITALTSRENLANLSQQMYLPPVRIDLLTAGSQDPYITIFDRAALVAKSWPDIDPYRTRNIFSNMTQAITSGQKNLTEAIQDTSDQYEAYLQGINQ